MAENPITGLQEVQETKEHDLHNMRTQSPNPGCGKLCRTNDPVHSPINYKGEKQRLK